MIKVRTTYEMAIRKDYYQVLGVTRDATAEEITRSFRKLAFDCHPDRNHHDGAAERFKEINEAYQVLSDAEKRARYDHWGNFEGRGFEDFDDLVGSLGDIFEAFFAGTSATRVKVRAPQQGADLRYSTTISFDEAVLGSEKAIEVVRTEQCPRCRGLGCEPGSQPLRCPDCNGTGEIRRVRQSFFGRFVNTVVCQRCSGQGSIVPQACGQCQGTGKEHQHRKITVKVPPGAEDGSQIRLRGGGGAGMWGGPPGDLYVTLSVREHSFFKRDGNDILYELPINFAQAALGDEVEVPTIEGVANLKIDPGTQTGRVFRLKGKGVPYVNRSGRGDQLVTIRVITPEKLDDGQRKLFVELSKSLDKAKASTGHGESLFGRIRKAKKTTRAKNGDGETR
jgi:molecular chaperone DnaJ